VYVGHMHLTSILTLYYLFLSLLCITEYNDVLR